MDTKIQHGYLVLADISGYTSYLAGTELDHAHEVLTELLELIIARFKSVLTLSKLEGDSVFAYAPESRLSRGETLLELIESTYVAFKDKAEAVRRRTTCTCAACRAIPTLDLKFIAHHGEYIVQHVAGIQELAGSDVNLVHRLLKNHVNEAAGWRAYALFTEKSLEHMGVKIEGAHPQVEAYEHLGQVQTYSLNLRARYKELSDVRCVVVNPQEAYVAFSHTYPVPPPVVWDWLNDSYKRAKYTLHEGPVFAAVTRPGGRTGVGARNHCVHGKDVAMVEDILDWKPFNYLTVEQRFNGFVMRMTCQLAPAPEGRTRMEVFITGSSPAPGFFKRPLFIFMMTRVFPMAKMFEKMGRCIAETMAHDQAAETPPIPAAA